MDDDPQGLQLLKEALDARCASGTAELLKRLQDSCVALAGEKVR